MGSPCDGRLNVLGLNVAHEPLKIMKTADSDIVTSRAKRPASVIGFGTNRPASISARIRVPLRRRRRSASPVDGSAACNKRIKTESHSQPAREAISLTTPDKVDDKEKDLKYHWQVLRENTCAICKRPKIHLIHYSPQCTTHLVRQISLLYSFFPHPKLTMLCENARFVSNVFCREYQGR